MTTNTNILPGNIQSNDLGRENNDIFKYLINYFDLDKNTLDIKIPYKFNDAIDYLGNISIGNLSTELKEIIPIEEKESMFDDEQNFSIDNIQILTNHSTLNINMVKTPIVGHTTSKKNKFTTQYFPQIINEKNKKYAKMKKLVF